MPPVFRLRYDFSRFNVFSGFAVKNHLPLALLFPALACAAANEPGKDPGKDPAMLELADRSRCLVCHDVDEKVTGPSWRDVAKRYRNDPAAFERLVVKVRDGGSGVWGDVVMSPNKRAGEENIRKLVAWILTLP